MARKSKRAHLSCRVQFEDYAGNLHTAVVRVPPKTPWTPGTVTKLAQHKTGIRVARIFGLTCSDSGRIPLPHNKRRHR